MIHHTFDSYLAANWFWNSFYFITDLENEIRTNGFGGVVTIKELAPPTIMTNQMFEREKFELYIIENGNGGEFEWNFALRSRKSDRKLYELGFNRIS